MSLLEIKQSDVTVNGDDDSSADNNNKKLLNDKNNNSNDQPQIILQTDEIITVVVSENSSKITREVVDDDDHDDDDDDVRTISESDKNFPKSILANNTKSLLRKKSVSFETSEDVKKFIEGEEIIDKKNPFRSNLIIDGDSNNGDKYRIIKGSKKSKAAPLASEENDFITKEEILKQSKCVPVYIRHPDKILTYPKPIAEKIAKPTSENNSRKIPVPLPRKSSINNGLLNNNSKSDKKEKKKSRVRNPNYPDLSDIKVKTGTDIDESLYDPNEVVLNVKKFDSRFKKLQFGSTDDLEEIVDREETSINAAHENNETTASAAAEVKSGEEKKSYTNTVNSEEFRQYLKKKGLLLFPIKANGESNGSAKVHNNIDETDIMEDRNGKRKSVFSRLSSIFSKGKTMPKTNEPLSRISYSNKPLAPSVVIGDNGNLGSNIKRVILERNSSDNRSVSANSEFMQHFNSIDNNKHRSSDEDNKSSISSVLTAAADDDDVDTPVIVRRNNFQNGSIYRHIDLNKSKLYQSKVRQNNNNNNNNNNGNHHQEDIIKPKVQRPHSTQQQQQQQPTKSLIKPPVPLRRSIERQSMPVMRRTMKIENSSIPRMANGSIDKIKNTSTPSRDKETLKSPTLSPIPAPRPSEIDPITFAKIHEIKKKTDEVLLNKSSALYDPKLQNNLRFARNSPQRSTMTEVYQNRLSETPQVNINNNNFNVNSSVTLRHPPRSQSVLDNMTAYKNSLYGEVAYRRPDGSNVNVMMRRPESSTMDRNQVMQKIYEYYRKSVNNTPVPFQRNLQYKSQSTDTSPVSYASVNTRNNATIDRKYYSRPSTMSSTKSDASRNHTISETDSVFLPENEGGSANFNGLQQKQQQRRYYVEPADRIYDVVYGENSASNSNGGAYGNINRLQQRPASAMGGSLLLQQQNRHAMGRMTPLILQQNLHQQQQQQQQPQPFVATRQGDIIINNQIYRPISTIPTPTTMMMSPNKIRSSLPQPQHPPSIQQQQQIKPQPIYSTPTRRKTATSYESDSEAGEIQSIMGRKYEEDYQNEKSSRNQQNEQVVDDRRRSSGRREDPRRHTLGADMMHYANQGGSMQRSMDLEMGQPQKSRKVNSNNNNHKLSYVITEEMYAQV